MAPEKLEQLRELNHEKARECFMAFVDEHFHNVSDRRVVTRIPAEKSDTDLCLGGYLQTVADALPELLDELAKAKVSLAAQQKATLAAESRASRAEQATKEAEGENDAAWEALELAPFANEGSLAHFVALAVSERRAAESRLSVERERVTELEKALRNLMAEFHKPLRDIATLHAAERALSVKPEGTTPPSGRGPLGSSFTMMCSGGKVTFQSGERFEEGGRTWEVIAPTGRGIYGPSSLGGTSVFTCRLIAGEPGNMWKKYLEDGIAEWCGDSLALYIKQYRDSPVGTPEEKP
jgi:hypothetical protein